jgi:hypothetical protein
MDNISPPLPSDDSPIAPTEAMEILERALSHALKQSTYWAERAAELSEALLAWSVKL